MRDSLLLIEGTLLIIEWPLVMLYTELFYYYHFYQPHPPSSESIFLMPTAICTFVVQLLSCV